MVTSKKTRTTKEEFITSIKCDLCGAECLKQDGGIEGMSITTLFSYGSVHDGMVWDCDLCDNCVSKKVKEGMGRLV